MLWVKSCVYDDTELGAVHVTVRSGVGRFIARWKGGAVYVTVPKPTSLPEFKNAMGVLKPRLLAHRPDVGCPYREGSEIKSPGFLLRFVKSEGKGDVEILQDGAGYVIRLSPRLDFAVTGVAERVDRAVWRLAECVAPRLLLPRAREIAAALGLDVCGWKIGRGRRTLGSCSPSRVITISCACVFLPEELRDYIVFHELAHLTEMNHSKRFHIICDSYCGGRERVLAAALKDYRWPVRR